MKVELKVPEVGESVTEATLGEWLKKDGDFVKRNENVLMLETDKASVEVPAEQEGRLEIKVQAGETVDIGTVVATIDTEAKAEASQEASSEKDKGSSKGASSSEPKPPSKPAPESRAPNGSRDDKAHPDLLADLSPAVQRMVEEKGLDPAKIEGTGKGGRILKEDVMRAADSGGAEMVSSEKSGTETPQQAPAKSETAKPAAKGETERVAMSTIRKKIAQRLVQAQQTAAILTTFNEVDMTNVIALRAQYKEKFKEKHNVNLGFMGFFTKAVIEGLKDWPLLNASIDGNEILYHRYYNIGVAVGTEKGLVVPVVRNADQLSIAEIEQSIKDYALKARDGKISINDLSGGTFTISNGGVYGSLMSTPILNPPQSGILGMHKMQERPVAINGEVKIRTMMYLALSYDHRIVDGKEAVSFLVKVKDCIEDPARLLIGV